MWICVVDHKDKNQGLNSYQLNLLGSTKTHLLNPDCNS